MYSLQLLFIYVQCTPYVRFLSKRNIYRLSTKNVDQTKIIILPDHTGVTELKGLKVALQISGSYNMQH